MNRLTRRHFVRTSAGAMLAGALAPRGAATARADAPDLGAVTLRIGDQTGAQRGKLRAAGLLDDVPYRIEWSVFAAAVDLHEALRAGAIDIGSANDSPTIAAMANGSRIKAVAAWRNGRGARIVVPGNSSIRTIADLKGRTVSPTTRGSIGHFLVVGELKRAGLALLDIKLAFLQPADAGAAFQTGAIDAWSTWGVFEARAEGAMKGRVLSEGDGVNSGLSLLSATDAALGDPGKRAAMADFARRIDRAYVWSLDNPDAFTRWFAGFARQDEAIARRLYPDEAAFHRVPVDGAVLSRMRQTYQTWIEAGLLKPGLDIDAMVDRGLGS